MQGCARQAGISIHALREEGDPSRASRWLSSTTFLSTPSARRATYLLTVPPTSIKISIHALREEGDQKVRAPCKQKNYFYPRPPRGGRLATAYCQNGTFEFLSTPSARRATRAERPERITRRDFYPRPPRGGRHVWLAAYRSKKPISIHALREEGDYALRRMGTAATDFYPRPPRGGRPGAQAGVYGPKQDFYPRPPRGGRLAGPADAYEYFAISIHALREEGDRTTHAGIMDADLFLSTPSARRATRPMARAPRRRRHFYPRPPRGGRRFTSCHFLWLM